MSVALVPKAQKIKT